MYLCSSLPAVRLSLSFLYCPAGKCGWWGLDLPLPLFTLLLLAHVATTTIVQLLLVDLHVRISRLVNQPRGASSINFAFISLEWLNFSSLVNNTRNNKRRSISRFVTCCLLWSVHDESFGAEIELDLHEPGSVDRPVLSFHRASIRNHWPECMLLGAWLEVRKKLKK